MISDRETLWQRAIQFHGHECPGLVIGARIAIDFLESGYERAEDEELVCICETDSCGVDAIQALLGCTVGKGNLWVRKRGKHVFTIFSRKTRIGHRYYWKAYGCGEQSRSERSRFFLTAPQEQLYEVTDARYNLPPEAIIHKSVFCGQCGERTAEANIRVREGQMICLDCAGYPLNFDQNSEL